MKLLTAAIVAAMCICTTAYAEFDDMKEHWAREEVDILTNRGIINGVTLNQFMPEAQISRAEFFALVSRACGYSNVAYRNVFNDVNTGDWYANTLQTCFDKCLIDAVMMDSGFVNPKAAITREEAASVIVKAYDSLNGQRSFLGDISGFSDNDEISLWARSYVRACCGLDIVKGKSPDVFAPKDNMTRAEAAVIVKRFADKAEELIIKNKQAQLAVQNTETKIEEIKEEPKENADDKSVGEQISYGPEFAGNIIYSDDFEKYATGDDLKNSKWKITHNNAYTDVVKVSDVSKAVVFKREKEDDNNTIMQLNITPISSTVAIEQKMMSMNATKEEGRLAILGSDGNYATNVMFHKNSLMVNRQDPSTGASSWESVASFVPGKWYDVKLLIDVKKGTFDVYVDGVLKGDDWKLRTKVSNVAKILNFIFGDSNGDYYFDDFKITEIK